MSDEIREAIEQLRREMRAGFAKLGEARSHEERPAGALETGTDGTVSLGALIDALSNLKAGATVWYDFVHLIPTTVASYRGYYDHLALGYGEGQMTVAQLLSNLREALVPGKTYEGWKGGEYQMSRETPVWVANPGESGSTAIVGLRRVYEDYYVLVTEQVD